MIFRLVVGRVVIWPRLAFVLASLMLAGLGAALAEDRPAPGVYHVVEPGQTLWRIARTYRFPLEELARVNGIEDATSLAAGQSLLIPGASSKLEIHPYPAPVPERARPKSQSFIWPVSGGEILSRFGAPRHSRSHKGLDIRGRHGQDVLAACAGRVTFSGASRGYGKTVVLDHGDGFRTLYAHNASLFVSEGDWVEVGQRLASVGRTGNASTEHCHFEVHQHDVPVDPLDYLVTALEGER